MNYQCKQLRVHNNCCYNIENTDLEIRVSGFTYIYYMYNILTHIDVQARLAHFTRYTSTYWNRMIQRSLLKGRGTPIHQLFA